MQIDIPFVLNSDNTVLPNCHCCVHHCRLDHRYSHLPPPRHYLVPPRLPAVKRLPLDKTFLTLDRDVFAPDAGRVQGLLKKTPPTLDHDVLAPETYETQRLLEETSPGREGEKPAPYACLIRK